MNEASRLSSSFRRPEAASRKRLPSEFEQTSSAKSSVWWAGVRLTGRISHSSTEQPDSAACQAASHPARPPPMTVTSGIGSSLHEHLLRGRDRKSTRLNSSHANISYAVFCLKKKKQKTVPRFITTSI